MKKIVVGLLFLVLLVGFAKKSEARKLRCGTVICDCHDRNGGYGGPICGYSDEEIARLCDEMCAVICDI